MEALHNVHSLNTERCSLIHLHWMTWPFSTQAVATGPYVVRDVEKAGTAYSCLSHMRSG